MTVKEKLDELYKRIRDDFDVFRKNRDIPSLGAVRFIIGEIQRDPNKDYSNSNVKKMLKSIRKNMTKSPEPDHLVMSLVDTYVGHPVASGEVIDWLRDNGYDKETVMSQSNPFAIIGILKKAFGDRELDGNMVKDILAKIISGDMVEEKPMMVEDLQGEGLMMDLINEMYPDKNVFEDAKRTAKRGLNG